MIKRSAKHNTELPEPRAYESCEEAEVRLNWEKYGLAVARRKKSWPLPERDKPLSELQNQRLEFARDAWIYHDERKPRLRSRLEGDEILAHQNAVAAAVQEALRDFTRMETNSTNQIQMRICFNVFKLLRRPFALSEEAQTLKTNKYPTAEAQILRNKNLMAMRKKIEIFLVEKENGPELAELYQFISVVLNSGFPAEAIADNQFPIRALISEDRLTSNPPRTEGEITPQTVESEREALNDFVDNFLLWNARKETPSKALIFYFKFFCQMSLEEIWEKLEMLGFTYEINQIKKDYTDFCNQVNNNKFIDIKNFVRNEDFCFEGEKEPPLAVRISTLEQNLYGLDVSMIQRGNFSVRNRLGLSVYPFCRKFVNQQHLPGFTTAQQNLVREEISQELALLVLNKLVGYNPRKGAFPLFILNWIRPIFGVLKKDMDFLRPSRHLVEVLKFLAQNPDACLEDLVLKFPRIMKEDLKACVSGAYNFRSISVDQPIYEDDGSSPTPLDRLPQLRYTPNIESHIDDKNVSVAIHEALQLISPLSRAVIEGRILGEKTLREVGQEVKVSHEKIRRIENLFWQTVAKIRAEGRNDAPRVAASHSKTLENDFQIFIRAILKFS